MLYYFKLYYYFIYGEISEKIVKDFTKVYTLFISVYRRLVLGFIKYGIKANIRLYDRWCCRWTYLSNDK